MRRLKCILFSVVALGASLGVNRANAQAFIDPSINLDLPTINFDSNINPVAGTFSNDALNIIRAHRVALQQVQAALRYLQVHRSDILEGNNAWYNEVFGDFYNPNSAFSGLYNRTLQVATGEVDRFGNLITQEQYNMAHFDRVLNTFLRIQQGLNTETNYAWGAQPTVAANQLIFDTYRSTTPLIGDPLFGNAARTITEETGLRKWGLSTSFTPKHLAQIATDPANPLRWDEDNDVGGTLTPDQELAFFRDRLTAYSVSGAGTLLGGTTDVYVGGSFLNELMRSNSTVPGEPNPFFHPTELKQYQQLIEALAESEGSLGYSVVTTETTITTTQGGFTNTVVTTTTVNSLSTVTPGTTTSTSTSTVNGVTRTVRTDTVVTVVDSVVEIGPGLLDTFGEDAFFLAALDSRSYGIFTDLFKPVTEGGTGDGNLLPPPGKQGTVSSVFVPVVPTS